MDKKDKILIMVAPVAVLTLGYVFFGDKVFEKPGASASAADDFTSIEAPVTEARKKRTELYRDKYEKENADKIKRNIQSDEFFFGEEIKRDSVQNIPAVDSTNTQPEAVAPSTAIEPPAQTKKQPKPKVIVKYIDRPSADAPQTVAAPESPKRIRRAGFASQSSSPATPKQSDSNIETPGDVVIPVVIQETTDVRSGSNIQLRTLEEIKLNGVVVPKNTLVTGIVAITQERINVKVNSIKGINRTVQMKLNAYDLDGNEGMPVEGGVNKEIKKDVVGSAIQETGKIVKIPLLDRLPTSAGNKKMNDPVIPVPKGYKLFLKPEPK